jgi:hypothetical protein
MGGAGGIAALHTAGRTVQLQRISFVPAQHPDTASLPEGVDIIYLGGSTKVFDGTQLLQEITFQVFRKVSATTGSIGGGWLLVFESRTRLLQRYMLF